MISTLGVFLNRPEYMAFGAFGSVAGHELSHAFDQTGRLYNDVGKLEDWWSNVSSSLSRFLHCCVLVTDHSTHPILYNRLPPLDSRNFKSVFLSNTTPTLS